MAATLPILPTTVIGAYGHPAWLYASQEWMANGRFGVTDVEETYNDAVDRAIADQEIAGIDVITDGEMRRESFVWAFAKRASGLREVDPPRKVGEISLDMRSVWETTYVASKGGLIALTRAMAREVGDLGIRVNAVAPGFTLTDASRGLFDDADSYGVSRGAIKRPGRPEDVVGAVIYLASDASAFVTGQTIVVDGGRQFI